MIRAAFSGIAPARIAALTALSITMSSGSSPAEASTTVIRLISAISGPPIGQKISSAREFAAAKTGMTSAPCVGHRLGLERCSHRCSEDHFVFFMSISHILSDLSEVPTHSRFL
ncbi:MAG: hypothetical protein MUE45_08370 [Methanoregulaceae archaeon]|nr:hypothetical protein [Methanoregulaceae archaeon]